MSDERGAMVRWAHSYHAYNRLASDRLPQVLRPLTDEIEASGKIQDWAGVDLLRGLAFWLTRVAAHREAPEGVLDDEQFWMVVEALRHHPHARPRDRPPTVATPGPAQPPKPSSPNPRLP